MTSTTCSSAARSRRRARRSPAPSRAAPTRPRCSCSPRPPAATSTRGPRRPRPAADVGRARPTQAAGIAATLGVAFRCRRRATSTPGPNLEARARAARFAALPPARSPATPPTTRPRRCSINLLRGAGIDGLAGMAPGPTPPAPRPAPRRDRGAVRRPRPRRRSPTRPTPTAGSCATGSATRCCRCSTTIAGARRRRPARPHRRPCSRDDADLLDDAAPTSIDPTDARALAAAARRSPAGPCAGGSTADGYPPDARHVDRVLAVAAGGATRLRDRRRAPRRTAPPAAHLRRSVSRRAAVASTDGDGQRITPAHR